VKKVLLITYHFPPRASVASLRLRGLAKYLPEQGWEPIILTPAIPARSMSTFNFKVKLVETPYHDVIASWRKRFGLSPDRSVTILHQLGTSGSNNSHNAMNWLINRLKECVAYPDEHKEWYSFAIKSAEELLQKENVDALISSSGPATSHLIAKHLKTKFDIPWIADFRDLWTQNHYHSYNFIRKIIERRLELKTIAMADALVTVSKPLANELNHLHRGKPVHYIHSGFDPEELVEFKAQLTKKLTITYCGSFYGEKRDPSLLLKVINELITEGSIDPNEIQIRFYGPDKDCLEKKICLYELQNVFKYYGQVSREIVLNKQRESQILLLLNWNTTHPGEAGTCPGKVFEYLASQRPILAIGGPPGAITKILNETGAGVHVSKQEDLKKVLLQYYREYKEKGEVTYIASTDKIMKYSHKEMAHKFGCILSNITQTLA
jgi:glycosyltransferase involved in cell wall biosynthesis